MIECVKPAKSDKMHFSVAEQFRDVCQVLVPDLQVRVSRETSEVGSKRWWDFSVQSLEVTHSKMDYLIEEYE